MKRFSTLCAAFFLFAGLATPAVAQDWPQKTIRIVVAFGPGGGTDIIGRILAEWMQEKLGKPVLIENRPGAGGTFGNEMVANAEPDGYTLGIMTAGQIISAVTRKEMKYDTLTAFAPVAQVATASLLIVTRPDFSASSVKDLVAAAKADPGKIVVASPGFAATQHFAGEMFKQIAKVNLLHVQYRDLARGPQCDSRQPCACLVRHGLRRARPGARRPAQSARRHRQGQISGGAEYSHRHRVPAFFRDTT